MTLTVNQQNQIENRSIAIVYFVKLEFATATLYLSNFNRNFTWDSHTWIGLGEIGAISEIKSSDGTDPNAVTMTLNIANASLLSIGIGPVEEYRGLPASIYMCPLDETFSLIDSPIRCWSGTMDVVAVTADGSNSSISLRCEPEAKRLRRRLSLRVNKAQQVSRYPTDQGFDYQQDLLVNPQVWMSREAQMALVR